MAKVLIQLDVDKELLDAAQDVCSRLGMDVETAVRVFLQQMVAENGLPFRPQVDPFYFAANMRHLKRLHDDFLAGRNIVHRGLLKENEEVSEGPAEKVG